MKRLPKNKVVWCRRGDFPGWYGFCPSEAAWHNELKRLKADPEPYLKSDARCDTYKSTERGLVMIVTVNDRIDDAKAHSRLGVIGLIVHEATHVWQNICEDMGERRPGKECEAYSIQAIASELLEAYSRTRRKIL